MESGSPRTRAPVPSPCKRPNSSARQQSVKPFADAAHNQRLGGIQGIFTCQDDPFLDAGGEDGVGTSQSELQAAAPRACAGIWREGDDDGYYLWWAKGWSSFVEKWKETSPLGLRLVDIESFKSGSDVYFTGVWREGGDGHYLWHARSWRAFTDKWEELAAKNLRLTAIETCAVNNERRYVGVWRQGAGPAYMILRGLKTLELP